MVNEHLLRALQESRYQMLLDEAHRERLVKEVKPKRKPEPRQRETAFRLLYRLRELLQR
ncbi:MAG: hypothetical protein GX495_11130 [Chloroflexi bacterium]|nr:hypothetical protein [Chloroflexota bacterium]